MPATAQEEPCLLEEDYMRLHKGHEASRFAFELFQDNQVVLGYVAADDLDPGAPSRKNRLYICDAWPYTGGNHRTDPACRQLRFSMIRKMRLADR